MSPASEVPNKPPARDLFHCDVAREHDTATVRTVGELDMAAVPIVSDEIARLREAGCRQVIFDLSELSFLDSSGLRLLLDCHAEGREDGYTMALIPGPPEVQRVFELTGTAARLPFIVP